MTSEITPAFYVSYAVDGKLFQAGPYDTIELAVEHQRDIAGYCHVKRCFIDIFRDERRQLIGEQTK